MSPSGKLHCVRIETFIHSSHRADWVRPISHRHRHYCIVTKLNHRSPPRLGWYKKLNQLCVLPANWQSRNSQLYLSLFIFSELGGVQPKFSPVLIHNIESMQITQLIADNIKVCPFLRDAMYNIINFLQIEKVNVDWSKQ